MAQRRPLVEGLKSPTSAVDPDQEKAFVYGGKPAESPKATAAPNVTTTTASVPTRVQLSTKMRSDLFNALKRASLERQLAGVEPNTLQDILEQAVEPWLANNGYLR
jgi:hypothetical protein